MARKAIGNVGNKYGMGLQVQPPRVTKPKNQQQLFREMLEKQMKAKAKTSSPRPVGATKAKVGLPKAKRTSTPRSVVPRGPRGLASVPSIDLINRQRKIPRQIPGQSTSKSSRGAAGSIGRRNRRASDMRIPSMFPRQYSYQNGGLTKSTTKLKTGIKNGL